MSGALFLLWVPLCRQVQGAGSAHPYLGSVAAGFVVLQSGLHLGAGRGVIDRAALLGLAVLAVGVPASMYALLAGQPGARALNLPSHPHRETGK